MCWMRTRQVSLTMSALRDLVAGDRRIDHPLGRLRGRLRLGVLERLDVRHAALLLAVDARVVELADDLHELRAIGDANAAERMLAIHDDGELVVAQVRF